MEEPWAIFSLGLVLPFTGWDNGDVEMEASIWAFNGASSPLSLVIISDTTGYISVGSGEIGCS